MKNIRSLLKLGEVQNGSSQEGKDGTRELQVDQDASTLRCFYECVHQAMTAEECVEYIETILGGKELPGHEIPNLKIKISPPRTVEQVKDSYWMFGVPTNIYGEVDCGLNGGVISYPWPWKVNGVGVSIPEVPCAGLDVNECCDKVLATMTEKGIPLVDDNGNCFSCWPHQEPLEPVIGAGGEVAYVEHALGVDGTCEAKELSPFEVQAADATAGSAITSVVESLDSLLASDPAKCADLEALYESLLMNARAIPQAMSRIPGMLCGFQCNTDGTFTISEELTTRLLFIRKKLTTIEIKSDENCIIIYTDRQGNVVEPPKIGGSREGLDVDLDDPDCTQPTTGSANSPVSSPTAVVCTGANEMVSADGTACVCANQYVRNQVTGACEMCKSPFVYSNGVCVETGPVCDGANEMVSTDGKECVCADLYVRNQKTRVCEMCKSPLVYSEGSCVQSGPICDGANEMISADGTACECADQYVRNPDTGACEMCKSPFIYSSGVCVETGPVCDGANEMVSADGKECVCADLYVRNANTGDCELCKSPLVYSEGACVQSGPVCDGANEMTSADGTECLCKKGEYHRDSVSGECVPGCGSGREFDWNSQTCKCQSNKIPNPDGSETCVDCQAVYSGTQFDWNSKSCICQSNKIPNPNGDGSCVDCPQGTQFDWNSQSCQCQWGWVMDSKGQCKQCPAWPWSYDSNTKTCVCNAYGYSLNSKGECVQSNTAPAPVAPVRAPVAPVPAPVAPVPAPVAPVPTSVSMPISASCACEIPQYLSKFALITQGDAILAPKTIYKGIAIGGTLDRVDTSYNIVVSSNYGDTKSYVYKEAKTQLNINYNGQGVQRGTTLSQAGIDFEALKCLAGKLKPMGNGDQNQYNIFVMTRGGTFNLFDFHKEGQGENNGKTLVVFNTSEDVTLTNASGRQFGPSVLAPFSKVTLSNTGFIDGWVVAKTFNSLTSSDQMHADAYTGPASCA